MDKFNEFDLNGANREAQDLIQVAQFQPSERQAFVSQVVKELAEKNIALDCFR